MNRLHFPEMPILASEALISVLLRSAESILDFHCFQQLRGANEYKVHKLTIRVPAGFVLLQPEYFDFSMTLTTDLIISQTIV